jgi:hypothetical protein
MNRLVWMQILWPSFVAACLLQVLVFAAVDPKLLLGAYEPGLMSVNTFYSLAFFVFWAVTACSSAITAWLGWGDQHQEGAD